MAKIEGAAGPFEASALAGAVTVNGRSWAWAWDRANRTVESTSPAGRKQTVGLDEKGPPASDASDPPCIDDVQQSPPDFAA